MREDYLDYLKESLESTQVNPDLIENADLARLSALLTYYVRGERFCDGFWKEALDKGVFARILSRLRELLK
jgi:hypothetical protein